MKQTQRLAWMKHAWLFLLLASCGGPARPPLAVTSTSFAAGGPMTADKTVQLSWSGAPAGTKEFALVCDDPDAPTSKPFVHWLLAKLSKPEPTGGVAGRNDFGDNGYGPPEPPAGQTHHYHFRVYALDTALDLKPGFSRDELVNAMANHIIAEGEIVGTFRR